MARQLVSEDPVRPEGFREDPYERTEIYPESDYPTGEDVTEEGEDLPTLPVSMDPLEPQREDVLWAPNQVGVVADRATQLAGRSLARRRLLLINLAGADTAFLLRDPTAAIWSGVALAGGSQVEMFHNDAVWARCATGEATTVSVVSEYVPVED